MPTQSGSASALVLDHRLALAQRASPQACSRRHFSAFPDTQRQVAVVGPQHQVFFFLDQHRDMRDLEGLLDLPADLLQQFFHIQHDGGFPRDRIDRFQLRGPAALQRIQPGILQRHRRLGGKQGQQVDGFGIKVVGVFALTIQHAHHFVSHHERDCQFRTGLFSPRLVTRFFGDVGDVQRALLLGGGPDQTRPDTHPHTVKSRLAADLGPDAEAGLSPYPAIR